MNTNSLRIFWLLSLLSIAWSLQSHPGHDHGHAPTDLPTWRLSDGRSVDGSFLFHKGDSIYLETADHSMIAIHTRSLAANDFERIKNKIASIEAINSPAPIDKEEKNEEIRQGIHLFVLAGICLLVLGVIIFRWRRGASLAYSLLLLGIVIFLSFHRGNLYTVAGTDPEEMDKAFAPFKPVINTFWDNTYFYVESNGIPDHEMMTGIVKWQQQVPIPQCYIGNNAWPIPLNPEIAATPVPVNQEHFLRGAVAVAANGVPIFNPYTNTGLDALVDGQLDNFGGHSGRADDYHYHIAPLHLDSITADVLPIAYALDGFAIYGPLEPDGSPMKPLDDNHGHFGSDGVYHYHGTKEKPYMIGKMVGKVTEDNTMQIIPQAAAKGVRPALTPLNGAAITDCTLNSSGNGYVLTYQRNNLTYKVDYSWTASGKYTFNFISPTGTTTSVYNGFVPCAIKSANEEVTPSRIRLVLSPNPASVVCQVTGLSEADLARLRTVIIRDMNGRTWDIMRSGEQQFSISHLPRGTYVVSFYFTDTYVSRKLVIQ